MKFAENSDWLPVVEENVRTLRFGVVQIVVHDSKVVQVDRTERTRFDKTQSGKMKRQTVTEDKS